MIGEKLGSYAVTAKISEGGMGVVYRGEHAILGRAAAIKVLLPTYSQDREVVQRFFNEARATTTIKHPGIVEIYDFGYHDDGRAFIVMELLGGETLAARLKRVGRIEEGAALLLARGIAGALAAAHDAGIIHRDLKPDNVFLVADGDVPGGERPKLLDFGIAKLSGTTSLSGSATRTGMLMGTPAYMAPEQCRGAGDVDARADLYALGCILHEMVCGQPPFTAEGVGEVMGKHLFVDARPARQLAPDLSAETEAIIMRLLAKDPAGRFASARQLAHAITDVARARAGGGWPVAQVTPGPYVPLPPTAPTTLGGAAGAVEEGPATAEPIAARPPRRRLAVRGGAAGIALVLGLVGWRVLAGGSNDDVAPAATVAAAPRHESERASPTPAGPPASRSPAPPAPAPPPPAVEAVPIVEAAAPPPALPPPPPVQAKKPHKPTTHKAKPKKPDDFPMIGPAGHDFPILAPHPEKKP